MEEYEYTIIGEPRWGDGLIGHLFSSANETNSIIGDELYMAKTEELPWIPKNIEEIQQGIKEGSIMARIVTSCVMEVDDSFYVRCYNTHLDYGVPTIQRRQMDELLKIIDRDYEELQIPIVLTGDFNAALDSENMKYFRIN